MIVVVNCFDCVIYFGCLSSCRFRCVFFFFFQAEDGIRDYKVTGVQTCALPICVCGPDDKQETCCGSSSQPSLERDFPCSIWTRLAEIGRASCRERV